MTAETEGGSPIAQVSVFPPGCNHDGTRAPSGQRGDAGCLHHYAEPLPGCICPAFFDSGGYHTIEVNPGCTAHDVPGQPAGLPAVAVEEGPGVV